LSAFLHFLLMLAPVVIAREVLGDRDDIVH
jgi:hypothetical protein